MLTTRFLIILFLFISCQSKEKPIATSSQKLVTDTISTTKPKVDIVKLKHFAKEAKQFCKEKQLNTQFFLLVDIGLHSGIKRFFIWDFKKDTIVNSFLVSHGCGKNAWARDYSKDSAIVSNVDGRIAHLSVNILLVREVIVIGVFM